LRVGFRDTQTRPSNPVSNHSDQTILLLDAGNYHI